MTNPVLAHGPSTWEEAGRRVSAALDDAGCVVVVGDDPERAAAVALGIGRVQARRRRVAIADLVGELPALQRLVPADLAHGVIDAFEYGVSLGRIAHPIDPARNLYILPSGVGPVDQDALLRDERWRSLAASFRHADALLLLVTSARAGALSELIASAGGAVVAVGAPRLPDNARVIQALSPPALSPMPASASPLSPAVTGPVRTPVASPVIKSDAAVPTTPVAPVADTAVAATGAARPAALAPGSSGSTSAAPGRPRYGSWIGAGAVVVAATAVLVWAARSRTHADSRSAADTEGGALGAAGAVDTAAVVAGPAALSVGSPESPASAPASSAAARDAADSAAAAAYAIEITRLKLREDASALLEQNSHGLPAATLSAIGEPGGDAPYPLLAGAYRDPAEADSLLRVLRRQRVLAPGQGAVVRVPYALLVADGVARGDVEASLARYRARGLPAYALLQDDGTARLYAGAFETPEQALLLAESLPAEARQLRVTYRTGRVF